MRSYEFSLLYREQKTEIIKLGSIWFLTARNYTVSHQDDNIFLASSASCLFEDQKNIERIERTTNKNNGDLLLNPMHIYNSIVCHLRKHTTTNDQTPIYSYVDTNSEHRTFSQSQVLDFLCNTTFTIREDRLGFYPNEISTQLIRTSATIGWQFSD